jgi:16S rRNA processing protein RimM
LRLRQRAGTSAISDSAASSEFITLARIVKTQGRRGEVAAEVHSNVPERFAPGMRVQALPRDQNNSRRELEIEELWPHKGLVVLKFAGIDSISDAETLLGAELQIPRSERAALKPGWTYVSDLAGCSVFDQGREIGSITDVQFGAGEAPLLIVVGLADSSKKFEIPFAQAYLESVDLSRRQLRMHLPEGLLEVNAPLTAEEKQEQAQPPRKKKAAEKKHAPAKPSEN